MSYNQYPPPGQYDGYGQQQWGQSTPPGYGGYLAPGAPPPQSGAYPPPQQPGGYPSQQPGGYPPQQQPGYPLQPGYPPQQPGTYPPQQSGGYSPYSGGYAQAPGAPPPSGGYGAPPAPGGYAPPGTAPPQHAGYSPSYINLPGPPAPAHNYPSHPGPPHAPAPPVSASPPVQTLGTQVLPPPQGILPHQQYGVPAQYPGYGGYPAAIPAHQGPPMYLGVSIPPPPPSPAMHGALPGYDVNRTVEAIRKAMKGFGTDEKALTAAIAPLDPFQVDAVRRTFEATTGKGLVKAIEKETSSWYEYALRAKVLGPVLFDCWLIRRACDGAGTHEDILVEVLLDRTNVEMQILKAAYQATYNRDLASTIRSELSQKTERLFNMALVGNREEGEYVEPARVQADVQALYKAGEGKVGTDEITICGILVSRSSAHLRALAQAYPQQHRRQLSKALDREFSGHMDTALWHIASGAEGDGYGVHRDAHLLHKAMEGLGTKDERLVYRIIRAHWNRPRFEAIKAAFLQKYGKTLLARVRSETGGDYKDFMCAVIGS